ncbi:MAG: hypothetical protein M3044_14495 [Thermoproteota archaeon]|jgi:hypothetical protein|nr:hypothetical protein [Thermoproteota archaeon]
MSHKDELTVIELIDKMIRCEIFKGPAVETEEGCYDVHALQFTEKFSRNCIETLARLRYDPNNMSLNTWEGFKSVVVGSEVLHRGFAPKTK